MNKLLIIGLLGLMGLVSISSADLVLPESSHYQGSTYFSINTYDEVTNPDGGYLRGRIDFAVYDTENYPDEFVGLDGYTAPGDGRYIYAYQVFNYEEPWSTEAIEVFSVLNIDGGDLLSPQGTSWTGTDDVVDPDDAPQKGVWVFDKYTFIQDTKSSFLIYSSDYDWVEGTYQIEPVKDDTFPVPDDSQIPEPATVVLFAIGSGLSLLRRKK